MDSKTIYQIATAVYNAGSAKAEAAYMVALAAAAGDEEGSKAAATEHNSKIDILERAYRSATKGLSGTFEDSGSGAANILKELAAYRRSL